MGDTDCRPEVKKASKERPLDVVLWLRAKWLVRDLTQNDFNKAISDILKMEEI